MSYDISKNDKLLGPKEEEKGPWNPYKKNEKLSILKNKDAKKKSSLLSKNE